MCERVKRALLARPHPSYTRKVAHSLSLSSRVACNSRHNNDFNFRQKSLPVIVATLAAAAGSVGSPFDFPRYKLDCRGNPEVYIYIYIDTFVSVSLCPNILSGKSPASKQKKRTKNSLRPFFFSLRIASSSAILYTQPPRHYFPNYKFLRRR